MIAAIAPPDIPCDRTLVRALSLWQPWASLLVLGEKTYETRSWATEYRGLLAIHAAQRWTPNERYYCEQPIFKEALRRHGITNIENQLSRGALLGIVNVIDCVPTELFGLEDRRYEQITDADKAFGNWLNGRFAWRCEVVRVFKTPIPYRGSQGFFGVRGDVLAKGGVA